MLQEAIRAVAQSASEAVQAAPAPQQAQGLTVADKINLVIAAGTFLAAVGSLLAAWFTKQTQKTMLKEMEQERRNRKEDIERENRMNAPVIEVSKFKLYNIIPGNIPFHKTVEAMVFNGVGESLKWLKFSFFVLDEFMNVYGYGSEIKKGGSIIGVSLPIYADVKADDFASMYMYVAIYCIAEDQKDRKSHARSLFFELSINNPNNVDIPDYRIVHRHEKTDEIEEAVKKYLLLEGLDSSNMSFYPF